MPDLNDVELVKYMKKLYESYPKFNEKLTKEKGHEAFGKRVSEFVSLFADYYLTFTDILDFNQKALTLLQQVAITFKELEQDFNPDLLRFYFNIFSMYIKLQILLSRSFEQSKIIIATYVRAHHLSTGNSEPSATKVGAYLTDYAKPLERVRTDFENISAFTGNYLRKMNTYLTLFSDRTSCITKGFFTVLDKTSDATSHRHENIHTQALYVNSMRQWVLWGLLVCPQEFVVVGTVELVCIPLSETFLLSIHRNEVLNVQEEYEKLFSDFQIKSQKFKLSKYRQYHKDIMSSYDRCLEKRHDFRRYICAELHAARSLIQTSKSVAAPKLLFLLSLMRFGRDEVYWYFLHYGCRPYRCASKFSIPRDPHIVSIIADIVYISKIITTPSYLDIIKKYYVEQISMDASNFKTLRESIITMHSIALPAESTRAADEIQKTFNNIESIQSLEAFRLNIFRFLSTLSSSVIQIPSSAALPLTKLLSMAVLYSRAIDSLPKLVDQHAGLKQLYWRSDVLQNEFDSTLFPAAPGSVNSVSLISVLKQATNNVHRVAPEEQEEIGLNVVALADRWLIQLCTACVTWLHNQISYQSTLQSRLLPSHAVQRMAANDTPILPNQEPPTLPYLPGAESNPRLANELISQRNELNALTSIGAELGKWDSLIIYQHELSPREYFITAVQHTMRSTIRALCISGDQKNIRRPSDILGSINTLLNSYVQLDRVSKLDMATIARTVLLTEIAGVYPKSGGEAIGPASLSSSKAEVTSANELHDPIATQIVKWYSDLFSSDFEALKLCHSQLRQCFEARPLPNEKGVVEIGPIPAELYTDRTELRALATLLGPRGIDSLNKSLLGIVQRNVEKIFEILAANSQTLLSIRGRYTEPQAWVAASDAIQRKDQFVACSISIGCCLKFREMIQNALHEVSNDAIPTAVRAISSAIDAARAIVTDPLFDSRVSGLLSIGQQCGLPRSMDDRDLRDTLRRFKTSTQDAQLWTLLPEMYCLCFNSPIWIRSYYDINAEGHRNNVHLVALAIRDLISVFVLLPAELKHVPQNALQSLKDELERFLHVASYSLLNINSHLGLPAPQHIIFFLQQYIEAASSLVPMSRLEKCFPYTLLRTTYIQTYEGQSQSYNVVADKD